MKRGFSLIEVMVVLGIIIILLAMIVPAIGPMRRQGRMRVGAATVAESLRLARSLAITQSAPYCVEFSYRPLFVPEKVRIYGGTTPPVEPDDKKKDQLAHSIHRLSENVSMISPLPPSDKRYFAPPPASLYFRADGSCSDSGPVGICDLGTPTDTRKVEVKATSGRVVVSGGAR